MNTDRLINTIRSVQTTTSNKNEVEILVAFDNDDETRYKVKETFRRNSEVTFYDLPPFGYWMTHEYLNFLASKATGEILFCLTDKCILKTKNWDTFLEPYKNKFIVSYPLVEWIENDGTSRIRTELLFFIVSHLWYSVLGKICSVSQADSSVDNTFSGMGIFTGAEKIIESCRFMSKNIVVEHDRRRGVYFPKHGQSTYYNENEIHQRKLDSEKLFGFLKDNPQYIP